MDYWHIEINHWHLFLPMSEEPLFLFPTIFFILKFQLFIKLHKVKFSAI